MRILDIGCPQCFMASTLPFRRAFLFKNLLGRTALLGGSNSTVMVNWPFGVSHVMSSHTSYLFMYGESLICVM